MSEIVYCHRRTLPFFNASEKVWTPVSRPACFPRESNDATTSPMAYLARFCKYSALIERGRSGCACELSRANHPHWPSTTLKESFDQLVYLQDKHNGYRRLAHQRWTSFNQRSFRSIFGNFGDMFWHRHVLLNRCPRAEGGMSNIFTRSLTLTRPRVTTQPLGGILEAKPLRQRQKTRRQSHLYGWLPAPNNYDLFNIHLFG